MPLQSSRLKCLSDAESQVATLHDKHLTIVCLPDDEVNDAQMLPLLHLFIYFSML
jgi:hypothetical protein